MWQRCEDLRASTQAEAADDRRELRAGESRRYQIAGDKKAQWCTRVPAIFRRRSCWTLRCCRSDIRSNLLDLAQAARQTGMSLRFRQRQNKMCVQYSHSCFPLPARGRGSLSIFSRFYESVFPGRLGGNRVSGHNRKAALFFQVRLHASPKFFFSALAITVAGDDF